MKKYTFGRTKYLLRVLLKSGNSAEFWVHSYSVSSTQMKWHHMGGHTRPLHIDYAEVEGVMLLDCHNTVWPFYSPLK